jgi:predicted PurR-regulated permease PerM
MPGFPAFAGLVFLLACVMLLRWEDLRDRILALAGESEVHLTSRTAREAAATITRYLRQRLLVNTIHGTAVGLALWWIGVPNQLVWGLVAGILRCVPYVGPVVATLAPILCSFASSDGWTQTWITTGALLGLELITNNVLEPWMYGACTGISPLAILVSAAFWTWILGPVGLVLSTPLTVCLLVVGKKVPDLRFLDVLFGDQPAFSRRSRLHQRLLAGDQDEAWEILREGVESSTRVAAVDETLLPALAQAGVARLGGWIDAEARDRIGALALGLADEL